MIWKQGEIGTTTEQISWVREIDLLDLSDVHEMVSLLRRCSNNLNQYAKRANETGSIYASDIEDLQERLDKLWNTACGILNALS